MVQSSDDEQKPDQRLIDRGNTAVNGDARCFNRRVDKYIWRHLRKDPCLTTGDLDYCECNVRKVAEQSASMVIEKSAEVVVGMVPKDRINQAKEPASSVLWREEL